MPLDIDLDPDDVRKILSEIDAEQLSDKVLAQSINDESVIVAAMLPDDWEDHPDDYPPELVELYVKRRAARESWNQSPTEVRKAALDASVSYDIQAFRGRLNNRVDEIEAILFPDLDGSTAAFVTATKHGGGESAYDRLRKLTKLPGAFRR